MISFFQLEIVFGNEFGVFSKRKISVDCGFDRLSEFERKIKISISYAFFRKNAL